MYWSIQEFQKTHRNRKKIEGAGCSPSKLKIIILTHGDFDHSGNAAYLSKKFGVKIAVHYDDSGMVERGNMFWNRKKSNIIIRMIASILSGFGKSERFTPDLYLEDGDDLSEYGFDAEVIHIPGLLKGFSRNPNKEWRPDLRRSGRKYS